MRFSEQSCKKLFHINVERESSYPKVKGNVHFKINAIEVLNILSKR